MSVPPASLKMDRTEYVLCHKELAFLAELWLVKPTRINEIVVSSTLGIMLQASTRWVGSGSPTSVLPEASEGVDLLFLYWLYFEQVLGRHH